jgi:hypothetical protein
MNKSRPLHTFRIGDAKVTAIAEMIHDADLSDDKFGRKEAFGIDEVLKAGRASFVRTRRLTMMESR